MAKILKVFNSISLIHNYFNKSRKCVKLYTFFCAATNFNCNYLYPSPDIECTLFALPLAALFAAPCLRPALLSEVFAADLPAGELFLVLI